MKKMYLAFALVCAGFAASLVAGHNDIANFADEKYCDDNGNGNGSGNGDGNGDETAA